jgi:hypothetical protein
MRTAVRLVLYPLALGLIVLAWQHRHPYAEDPTGGVNWRGVTAQGQAILGITTPDGHLTRLDTHLIERCSDGESFDEHWIPSRRRFVQHGENLYGRAGGPGYLYGGQPLVDDIQVRAQMGAHPHGTLRGQVTWTNANRTVRCESGPVSFALKRSLTG